MHMKSCLDFLFHTEGLHRTRMVLKDGRREGGVSSFLLCICTFWFPSISMLFLPCTSKHHSCDRHGGCPFQLTPQKVSISFPMSSVSIASISWKRSRSIHRRGVRRRGGGSPPRDGRNTSQDQTCRRIGSVPATKKETYVVLITLKSVETFAKRCRSRRRTSGCDRRFETKFGKRRSYVIQTMEKKK